MWNFSLQESSLELLHFEMSLIAHCLYILKTSVINACFARRFLKSICEMRDLIEDIISEGCIPTDWQESFIVSLYKGKGDALNRGNYRGLKLIEQVMKVLEHVVEGLIRQRVEIDEMQCGFMSGRGTTDAIFIVRQLQEKHLAANKPLYMAFVDLEKAFDRVPRDVIWWAMRKLGIDEWLVRLVQSMYKDVRSRVRVGDGYSEEFGVGVGVHQGSVLSPLFIIVLGLYPGSSAQAVRGSCCTQMTWWSVLSPWRNCW